MLDRNNNIIFIHIPRTGGTSIEKYMEITPGIQNLFGVFDNKATHHFTSKEIISKIGIDYWNSCWKFSVVRHPYSRMISEFYWRPKSQIKHFPNLKHSHNFIQFLRRVKIFVQKKHYNISVFHDHFIPQYEFLTIDNKLVVDKLIYFDKLDEQFIDVKDKLAKHNSLPKLQSSPYSSKDYNTILTPKAKELIYDIYKIDFEFFNFKK